MPEILTVWLLLFILCFVLAMPMLGGYVAEQKRRPWGEGVILGLLFGPLGVIVAGLLPTLEPQRYHHGVKLARRVVGERQDEPPDAPAVPIARPAAPPPSKPAKVDVEKWDKSGDPRMPKVNL
jgi:hypothetical protein